MIPISLYNNNARSFEWDELGIRIREWYTSDDDETSNDWEDSEIIDRAISSNFVQIFTINAYFDFDDIDNPVKTYLQNYDSPPLTANNFQNIVININQDKAILNDGWLFGSKTEEKEFYTNHYFQSTTSDGSLSAGHLLLAYFKLDGKTTIYKRTAFNMLELFGILGGMYEVLEVTLTILLSSTSQKVLYNSLLSKLYHVKTQTVSKSKSKKVLPINNIFYRSQSMILEEEK